ncbi:hypothetical protein [Gordonia sp. (in: high G+C Gram-positive bacteria)]|uniref:hypothetical protein n=1 Tax=Gordonia sp. (in: high G+C Gram-positive bacteria) TaxID=84139 RepID=UPI003C7394C1
MNPELDSDWAAEPQWKLTYTPGRVTASQAIVRDRGLPPASWYLTPWEVDAALSGGEDILGLVNRQDPRLPQHVAAHEGPAAVTLTCTRCGHTGSRPADFGAEHDSCTQMHEEPLQIIEPAVEGSVVEDSMVDVLAVEDQAVEVSSDEVSEIEDPVVEDQVVQELVVENAAPQPRSPADPSCREAWMAAARTGSLVDGIEPGWLSRDTEALDPWTVQLSFDINAYGPDHAKQIANLLATITGGRVSGLSN